MRSLFIVFFLAVLVALSANADVLFVNEDKMSLDILADTSGFRNGTLIGVGYGLNQRLELDLLYANVDEGGVTVQMVVPGFKFYVLKPRETSPWFLMLDGDYLAISTSSGTTANGYFLAGNLGMRLDVREGYVAMPYVGVIHNKYEIGTSTVSRTCPRVGAYLGIEMAGGSVAYIKPVATFMTDQTNTSVALGYHFLMGR